MKNICKINLIIFIIFTIFLIGCMREEKNLKKEEKVKHNMAGLSDKEIRIFLNNLKQAIDEDDKRLISNMICYPLRVVTDKKEIKVKNKEEFIEKYDMIFNKYLKKVLKEQKEENLSISWKGIMVGRGELWCAGIVKEGTKDYEIKITQINNAIPVLLAKNIKEGKKTIQTPTEIDEEKEQFVYLLMHMKNPYFEDPEGISGDIEFLKISGFENIKYDKKNKNIYFIIPKNVKGFENKKFYKGKISYNENGEVVNIELKCQEEK